MKEQPKFPCIRKEFHNFHTWKFHLARGLRNIKRGSILISKTLSPLSGAHVLLVLSRVHNNFAITSRNAKHCGASLSDERLTI